MWPSSPVSFLPARWWGRAEVGPRLQRPTLMLPPAWRLPGLPSPVLPALFLDSQDGSPAFILPPGALLPACYSYQGGDLTETHEAFGGFPGGTRGKTPLAKREMWV